jgi:hypothetical protein
MLKTVRTFEIASSDDCSSSIEAGQDLILILVECKIAALEVGT